MPRPRLRPALAGLSMVLVAASLVGTRAAPLPVPDPLPASIAVTDLQGRPVYPLAPPLPPATVFVFISTDCPICNRYAPELKRLAQECLERGVGFWLVHPVADESPAAVRQHAADYALPDRLVRDPEQTLSRLCGITITPEAALWDQRGNLVYRGRIDDRFPALGRQRPSARRQDLREALEAVLAGKPVPQPWGPAIGCRLQDTATPAKPAAPPGLPSGSITTPAPQGPKRTTP